jgi:hypothetical protein
MEQLPVMVIAMTKTPIEIFAILMGMALLAAPMIVTILTRRLMRAANASE